MARDNHNRTLVTCERYPEAHTARLFKDDAVASWWQAKRCDDNVIDANDNVVLCDSARRKLVFRYLKSSTSLTGEVGDLGIEIE
jgi:hypothetical protein